MTREEIKGVVTELGAVLQALNEVGPADKAEVYCRS